MYQAGAAAAAVLGILIPMLIWRTRKSAPAVPAAAADAKDAKAGCCQDAVEEIPLPKPRPRRWSARIGDLLDAIDYLRTQREWRYRTPWVLSLGEHASGKTSIATSVSSKLLQARDDRQDELAIEGTSWHFFEQGVLIDADGRLPVGADGSAAGIAWDAVLKNIDAFRPERPLDGILLTVSARTLLSFTAEQRHALAVNVLHQLDTIQERFEFMLPVYVVVTETDAVDGFSAFWNAQPAAHRAEIFGWSAPPSADSGTPQEWVSDAFDTIAERLKALLVNAAAQNDSIADVDRFFLFPRHFRQLRAPLSDWMSVVFHPSAWRAGFLCRGIYFTGSVTAAGKEGVDPRRDVDFVNDLLMRKVLAEQHLARPTHQGIWSRNKLIRMVQITGVTAFIGLAVALAFATHRLDRQIDTLLVSLKAIEDAPPAIDSNESCIAKERVYDVLEQVARIDTNTLYWVIPASWVDWRASNHSAHTIAENAFRKVIMPGIACRLALRAQALSEQTPHVRTDEQSTADSYRLSRQALFDRLQAVQTLEFNLERFRKLAAVEPQPTRERPMYNFFQMTEYAYGSPLPLSVLHQRGALEDALVEVEYDIQVVLPEGMRQRFAKQIEQLSSSLRIQFDREVQSGDKLVKQLSNLQDPILDNTRHFTWWLNWMSKSWLGSTLESNPCEEIRADLLTGVDSLIRRYGYPANLTRTGDQFDAASCYKPAMKTLTAMQLPPYGPLFVQQGKALQLNSSLLPELSGLSAMSALNYMQVSDVRGFSCRGAMSGWRAAEIGQAAGYAREYQNFAKAQGLPANGTNAAKQPLYDRLAQRQLETAMGGSLRDAQMPSSIAADTAGQVSLDATSLADRQLSQQSNGFAAVLDSLQGVLKTYGQYDFKSGPDITQCVRNFASDNLAAASTLASASRLYEPEAGAANSGFFDLGTTPVTKDYLARQVARSQVLASYATPFVNFLQNSTAVNDAQKTNDQTAPYWSNTIAELNRYVQFKEPNGQVAQLDTLFLKQLPGLDASNCGKTQPYVPAEYGNDLFSSRRKQIDEDVRWRCDDNRNAQGYAAYRDLSQRFNRELAGRYPFGDANDPNTRDASLAAVRAFFAQYETQRVAARQALASLTGTQRVAVQNWFDQLDAVSTFFNGTLTAATPSQPLQLTASFNMQTPATHGADQLVSWSITSGARTIGYPNRAVAMDWPYGQPLVLDLAWANRSLLRPIRDTQQADLRIDGATASFTASGDWALLRLAESHRPQAVPATDALDPNRIMLEFRVPVVPEKSPAGAAPADTARLYLGLTLAAKDPKTQAPLALTLPASFPRFAPNHEDLTWTRKSRN